MEKPAIKDVLYSGILELANNREFYYTSSFLDHCEWTEKGKQAVLEYVSTMAHIMMKEDKRLLEIRAKELVVNTLKKEVD
jgi:hypothetical protein